MTSIRYVRPYLPLTPGHTASASFASTTPSTRLTCRRSGPNSVVPRYTHRKMHSTSSQAPSGLSCSCECAVHCACRTCFGGLGSAKRVTQQTELSAAQSIANTYPTQLLAVQAAPSATGLSQSPITASASDRVPFLGKVVHRLHTACEASPGKELSPTFAGRKALASRDKVVQAPFNGVGALQSDSLCWDVRTTRLASLSLARKSQSFDLGQGVAAPHRPQLRRTCSNPEMTQTTSSWVMLAGHTHNKRSTDSSLGLADHTHGKQRADSSLALAGHTRDRQSTDSSLVFASHTHSKQSTDSSRGLAGRTCTRQGTRTLELAGHTRSSSTDPTSATSKQGLTRSSSKRKRSQNDTLAVDKFVQQRGPPQMDKDGADWETDSSPDDSFPRCTCRIEDEVYLGVDIPLTNLGLTSTELMLLF